MNTYLQFFHVENVHLFAGESREDDENTRAGNRANFQRKGRDAVSFCDRRGEGVIERLPSAVLRFCVCFHGMLCCSFTICFTICFTVCLCISPDSDGNQGTKNETLCFTICLWWYVCVSRYVCVLVRTDVYLSGLLCLN